MGENPPTRTFSFRDTTATRKVFSLTKGIRAVKGGTSASKTISILVWFIDWCQTRHATPKLASVVSESFPHLEKGAIADFRNIMRDRGYWDDARWNGTKHFYTFETGNVLEFMSVDKNSKAHGPRRDALFLNEANNLPWNVADQLMTRTRGVIWMDWNPLDAFWFHEQILGKTDDLDYVTLTYLDNEALDPSTVRRIESHRDNKNWWRVYGEGQEGEVENRIYKDWETFDSVPEGARLLRYGLDFGYTNDPTAIVALYRLDGREIVDEVCYRRGMSNREIAELLKALPPAPVMADSAEPKSIDELRSWGLPVMPVSKGQGSVNAGIGYVQDRKIGITRRSVDTLKEYRNYLWSEDRDGRTVNVPTGEDHALDAIRYAFDPEIDAAKGPDGSLDLIMRNRASRTDFK